MDKEQQIEHIANMISAGENAKAIAENVYRCGYRRADEVRKETAKEILSVLATKFEKFLYTNDHCHYLSLVYDSGEGQHEEDFVDTAVKLLTKLIKKVSAEEYGVEIEK